MRYRFGVLLRANNRPQEAADQFARALEAQPAFSRAAIMLGATLRDIGRDDEAVEAFKNALELPADLAEANYRLALLQTNRDALNKALGEMTSAGPDDAEQARAGVAHSLQEMALMDGAAATWRSLWRMHREAQF